MEVRNSPLCQIVMAMLAIFINSCSQRVFNAGDVPILGYDESSDTLPDIIKDVELIPLELTENSMLGEISKVEYADTSLIVFDRGRDILARFSSKGKYLNSIGNKGRAESEYLRIDTFFVDSSGRIIIIDGTTDKVLIFNQDGTYVKCIRYPMGTLEFINDAVQLGNGDVFVNDRIFNFGNALYSLLPTGRNRKITVESTLLRSPSVACFIGPHPISMMNNDLKFIKPFDNQIYTLNNKGEVEPIMTIVTSSELPGKDLLSEPKETTEMYLCVKKKGYFQGFTSIFETEKYILLDNYNNDNFLIDKTTMSGYRYNNNLCSNPAALLPRMNVIMSTTDSFVAAVDGLTLLLINEMFQQDSGNKMPPLIKKINSLPKGSNPCLVRFFLK